MSQADVQAAMMMGGMYGPNPYSKYPNGLSLSDITYRGTPTDAMGNPIQPPPGMTLNSTPAAAPAAAAPNPASSAPAWSDLARLGSSGDPMVDARLAQRASPLNMPVLGITGSGPGSNTGIVGYVANPQWQGRQAAPQAAPQQQAAPQAGGSFQNALDLLSNPGKVTTPGATVPQSQIGGQPSVLQQFLANQKGGTGAGNYSNTGFFDTLNRLGGQ